MKKYKLSWADDVVIRDDGACIPADPDNRDYQEYQGWLAEGNTPDPADPKPPQTASIYEVVEALLLADEGRPEKLDAIKAKRR